MLKLYDINVVGCQRVAQSLWPNLKQATDPNIFVLTSIAGQFGCLDRLAYGASKFGLEGWLANVAIESMLRDNIAIIGAAPGRVDTQMAANRIKQRTEVVGKKQALWEMGATQAREGLIAAQEVANFGTYVAGGFSRALHGTAVAMSYAWGVAGHNPSLTLSDEELAAVFKMREG